MLPVAVITGNYSVQSAVCYIHMTHIGLCYESGKYENKLSGYMLNGDRHSTEAVRSTISFCGGRGRSGYYF